MPNEAKYKFSMSLGDPYLLVTGEAKMPMAILLESKPHVLIFESEAEAQKSAADRGLDGWVPLSAKGADGQAAIRDALKFGNSLALMRGGKAHPFIKEFL